MTTDAAGEMPPEVVELLEKWAALMFDRHPAYCERMVNLWEAEHLERGHDAIPVELDGGRHNLP